MSARFAELMALSAAQTQDSVVATQQILEEKRKKEEQRKKEQLEKEKRDREYQARLIKKKLEEQQQAEERKLKQEEVRRRKEDLIRQREDEHRRDLIYGKDRRAGGSSSSGRGRKVHDGSDDEVEAGGLVLTREEKRQRKLFSDLNKSFPSARKGHPSPASQSSRKSNRPITMTDPRDASSSRSLEPRHPGSAGSNLDSAKSIQSVRKQLAAMPTTLMRLGTTKRDVRTIDEIVTDLHKKKEAKVIDGEEARKNGFDWFGEQKKLKKAVSIPSLSPSPEARSSQSPRSRSKEPAMSSKSSSSAQPRAIGQTSERKEPRTKVTIIRPESVGSLSFSKINKVGNPTPAKLAISSRLTAQAAGKLALPSHKKRARSDSLSDSDVSMSDEGSPPPVKRRPPRNDISSEIWKLFGKDRNQYMQNDVFSDDDDDMEADAEALRREEMRSARIAKKEDELAAEQEKRHEEEKRKKKKEKERRGY